jgi:dihydrofolate reductase
MKVAIIVAADERDGIGYRGRIPWHLPADLRRFKALTMGHHLIMGRKTFESIGRPLPGRTTIVLTRQSDYTADGCRIARSLRDALQIAEDGGETEVFICGGAAVYRDALGVADTLYLTRVHAEFQADTRFPGVDPARWVQDSAELHPSDEKNLYPFTFLVYHRISPPTPPP